MLDSRPFLPEDPKKKARNASIAIKKKNKKKKKRNGRCNAQKEKTPRTQKK